MTDSYGSPRVNISCFCKESFQINDRAVGTREEWGVERSGADDQLRDDNRPSHRVTCCIKFHRQVSDRYSRFPNSDAKSVISRI